jgi:hypothetical protein
MVRKNARIDGTWAEGRVGVTTGEDGNKATEGLGVLSCLRIEVGGWSELGVWVFFLLDGVGKDV